MKLKGIIPIIPTIFDEKGDIDPWDVDVIPVVDGFLDQLKQRIEIPKKIADPKKNRMQI